MAMAPLRLCLAAFAICSASATTPIARVISLLGKLEAQIEREGAKEAKEYDKFACYCKDEADGTQYAIEKSEKRIKALTATLEELQAGIDKLAGFTDKAGKEIKGEIKELEELIAEKEKDLKTAKDKRKKENDAYKIKAEDIADAIGALQDAIKEIKDKKAGVKDAKLNLLQDKLFAVLSTSTPTHSLLLQVQALSEGAPGKPAAYVYKSNDIIGTLQNLLKEFKEKKATVNFEEKEKLGAYEMKAQALTNERDFADKERIEKNTLLSKLKADHAKNKKDKDDETDDMKADQGFLKELTSDCETKAEQWDQRSSTRSGELTAISKAMEQLKGGVSKNYASNALAGASFLQLNRGRDSAAALMSQAAAQLSKEADRLHSASLAGVAMKLNLGGHFEKVENMVKDLIQKLKDEAKAAESSKAQCDEDMAKAVSGRDKNKLESEDSSATMAIKGALAKKLSAEVADLSKEEADLQKSLFEASELRSEEKADNSATVSEAEEGETAVDKAIEVLKDFYEGAQLLQVSGPAEGRDGRSIDDAPELSYDGDYKGKQDASKGIIGILEVIKSDFTKTISNTKSEEEGAVSDFEAFEKKIEDDIKAKGELKDKKLGEIDDAKADIIDAKEAMIAADKGMETAMKKLEEVKAMCLTGEGTFAERKKQREDEIKALGEALTLLQNLGDDEKGMGMR